MIILSVDTSSLSCSTAVVRDETVLAELTVQRKETHARHVMILVERVLAEAGLTLGQLSGLAVVAGPGTFTGLRIGLSTIQGLAWATGLPAAGVSSLASLAFQAPAVRIPVCAMIDARRGEVYTARFRLEPDAKGTLSPQPLEPEKIARPDAVVGDIQGTCLFIGSGAAVYRPRIRELLGDRALFAPEGLDTIRAASVAHLGGRRIAAGGAVDAAALLPVYLRRSDAEVNRDRGVSL